MSDVRPLIIKRKKAGGGDGHHGGAWKVAYADFVTAMMAFFLLMWLLNATSEDQRKGLADFFDPSLPISRSSAGGAGMLNGDTIFTEEPASGSKAEGVRPKPTHREPGDDLGPEDASPNLPAEDDPEGPGELSDLSSGKPVAPGATGTEDEDLKRVADEIEEKVLGAGGEGLAEHFSIRVTPEGLVIEIADLSGDPLFASGSAAPAPVTEELIGILVPVLMQTTNDIAVAGHTDARPFQSRRGYTNWELSADRANAARSLLTDRGLDSARITRVSGHAASDPIDADPNSARNRRIGIVLLRKDPAR
ncbi:MAG: flagellar motor protein MotB [Pseudomonadota bacterium]